MIPSMSRPTDLGALHVLLQFARAADAGDPFGFRFAPQDYILPRDDGATPTARLDWDQELLSDLAAVRQPGRPPVVVQRLGERLRAFVHAAGWETWEAQIAQAVEAGRTVIITIRSSAAELYALPWELLTLRSGQFLGEIDGLLLRYEWPESATVAEQPKPRPEGGRILLAWSAASGAVPVGEQSAAIARASAAGLHPFDAKADVLANASLPRISRALEEAARSSAPVAVLHILCHGAQTGSTFGLALDGEDGPAVVDATQLRQALAPFAKQVRLVVLSACDSGNVGALGNQLGSVAQALHRCGFSAVIASRFPLSVSGSIVLTQTLYDLLLGAPSSLETAFLAARKRLAQHESDLPAVRRSLDWASIQLYARHADGDDTRPMVFRPFRGLLAFQAEHRRFFFGRDAEIAQVLRGMQALVDRGQPRFLVVAGASGTGKSSLVLAGAVPQFLGAQPMLSLRQMRPGSQPVVALDQTLAQRPASVPLLLVVDQFEEIFTQTASATERDLFVRRLWSLASGRDPDVRVIITLRIDYLGRCGDVVIDDAGLRLDRVAYDEAHRVFVAQPGSDALNAAIEQPAHRVGLELQAGLTDRIVNDVGAEPGALPLLEDALDGLWQRRSDRTLTQAAYDALGGVVGALQGRADAIMHRLSRDHQTVAQRLLVSLVSIAEDGALDSRQRVPVTDLRQSAHDADAFDRVLHDLVDARLLVLDDAHQSPTVEVAHEALIRKWPRLRAWLDEDRAGLLIQRRINQAAQLWQTQQRDESLLFRGAQLAQATDWRHSHEARLSNLERSFLDASEALKTQTDPAAEQSARLRGSWLLIASQVLLYVVALAFFKQIRAATTSLTLVLVGTCILASFVVAAFLFRRTLMANSFHRGLAFLGITVLAQVVAVRTICWRLGLSPAFMLTVDAMVATGGVAVLAQQYLPWMWVLAVLLCGNSVANLFLPEHAVTLSFAADFLVLVASPYAWARAARSGDSLRHHTPQG